MSALPYHKHEGKIVLGLMLVLAVVFVMLGAFIR